MGRVLAIAIGSLSLSFGVWGAVDLAGLLLYLPLDEGSGTVVRDASDHGFQGETVDTQWTKGRFGTALEFDGIGSHVLVPGGVIQNLQKDEITMMAWFYLTGHDAYDGIISMTGVLAPIGGQCCQYRIMVNPSFHPFFDVGEHNDHEIADFTFQLETWYHYALTYDGSTAIVYVDGDPVGEVVKQVSLPSFDTPVLLGTGEAPGVHPLQGIIDEVWIFNRALSQAEVQEVMESGPRVLGVEPPGKLTVTWARLKTPQ